MVIYESDMPDHRCKILYGNYRLSKNGNSIGIAYSDHGRIIHGAYIWFGSSVASWTIMNNYDAEVTIKYWAYKRSVLDEGYKLLEE